MVLLQHLHKESDVCLVNLMMYAPDLPQVEVEEADWEQWKDEAKLRQQGLCTTYTSVLSSQDRGPLQKMVIPEDSSRRSRYTQFHRSLKRHVAARTFDFDRVFQAFEVGINDGSVLESIPLDILAEVLVLR